MPSPSAKATSLVVSTPRERLVAELESPSCPRCLLVDLNDCDINECTLAVGIRAHSIEKSLEYAGLGISPEPAELAVPVARSRRHVASWRTCPRVRKLLPKTADCLLLCAGIATLIRQMRRHSCCHITDAKGAGLGTSLFTSNCSNKDHKTKMIRQRCSNTEHQH